MTKKSEPFRAAASLMATTDAAGGEKILLVADVNSEISMTDLSWRRTPQ